MMELGGGSEGREIPLLHTNLNFNDNHYDGSGLDGVNDTDLFILPEDDSEVPEYEVSLGLESAEHLSQIREELTTQHDDAGELANLLADHGGPLRVVTEIGSDSNVWGATVAECVKGAMVVCGSDPFTARVVGEVAEAFVDLLTHETVQDVDRERAAWLKPIGHMFGVLHLSHCPKADDGKLCKTGWETLAAYTPEQLREQARWLDEEFAARRGKGERVRDGGDNTSFTGLAEDREWARMRAGHEQTRPRSATHSFADGTGSRAADWPALGVTGRRRRRKRRKRTL